MRTFTTNNIEVRLYKTKAAMRRAIRGIGYNCDHTEAMVIPHEAYDCKSGKCVKLPTCGELFIHEKVSMPVLVHETLHAATTAIRRQRKSLNLGRAIRKPEERLAYTQTSILQDILKRFFPKINSAYHFSDLNVWINGRSEKTVIQKRNDTRALHIRPIPLEQLLGSPLACRR